MKKPAAKKLAVKKKSAAASRWAELARKGKVNALYEIADCDSETHNDRNAYKWLRAAADYGHAKAKAALEDVMELTNLRYDDDGYEVAAAHWELGAAYLEGTDGLPLDLTLAKKHLAEAFRTYRLQGINEGCDEDYDAKPLAKRLSGPAKQLLADALARKLEPAPYDEDEDDDA